MFVRFLFFFSDGVSFVSAVEYRWYVDMRGCGIVSDSFLILLSCKNHLLFHGFSFISRQTGYRAHSLRSNNHIICAQLFLRFVCSIDKENYFFFLRQSSPADCKGQHNNCFDQIETTDNACDVARTTRRYTHIKALQEIRDSERRKNVFKPQERVPTRSAELFYRPDKEDTQYLC